MIDLSYAKYSPDTIKDGTAIVEGYALYSASAHSIANIPIGALPNGIPLLVGAIFKDKELAEAIRQTVANPNEFKTIKINVTASKEDIKEDEKSSENNKETAVENNKLASQSEENKIILS